MRRITVALSATALIGCGTAQKTPEVAADPPKEEERAEQGRSGGRVAKGAVGGAAMGALMCLGIAPAGLPIGGVGAVGSVLASLVCLPFGVVAGAVTGGTVAAVKSPTTQNSSSEITSSTAAPGSGYLTQGAFVLAASGQLESGDGLRAGSLYVAMNTIVVSADNQKRASLIVDFDAPTNEGEKSMIAQAVFVCHKGAATIQRSFTYAERFGHGSVVHSVEHAPAIVVETPGPVLASAVRTVCDAGPWWNTPAQLYGQ